MDQFFTRDSIARICHSSSVCPSVIRLSDVTDAVFRHTRLSYLVGWYCRMHPSIRVMLTQVDDLPVYSYVTLAADMSSA